MSSVISPKAEVSPKAKIGDGCKIFPFVYIEDDVVIGDNCVIFPFVSILNGTRMGSGNKIHQGSVLAALPQDFNFVGEKSELVMGDNNIIRENVVLNRATHRGCKTIIGSNNFLMEGAHLATIPLWVTSVSLDMVQRLQAIVRLERERLSLQML